MALQGGQGAPAALDLGGEFEPADRRLRPVVGGGDVESGGEQPHLVGFAFEPSGQLQAGVVALVPGPGQVRRDPDGYAVVVAAPQPGDQVGVGVVAVVGPGGVDLVDRGAEGVGDLAGPGLRVGVEGVGVVEVADHMRVMPISA